MLHRDSGDAKFATLSDDEDGADTVPVDCRFPLRPHDVYILCVGWWVVVAVADVYGPTQSPWGFEICRQLAKGRAHHWRFLPTLLHHYHQHRWCATRQHGSLVVEGDGGGGLQWGAITEGCLVRDQLEDHTSVGVHVRGLRVAFM